MIVITSVEWAKGFSVGCQGLGCESTAHDYVLGWLASLPIIKRKPPIVIDNGAGKAATGFSVGSDQSEDRRKGIIAQVRNANSREAYVAAMKAAYVYDIVLWKNLDAVYGMKWG